MTTKRPWTPGPWLRWEVEHIYLGDPDILRARANARLIQKAPDMAELLIRLAKTKCVCDLAFFAKELLKEIGYDPDQT